MSRGRRELPVPPTGVLCDLDNTLIDTTWRDYRSFIDAAQQFGIGVRPYEQFRDRRLAGWSSREIAREWNPLWETSAAEEAFLRVRHQFLDRLERMHTDRLFDGVRGALGQLLDAGIPMAVATLRSANGQTQQELDRLGIGHCFSHVVTADQVFGDADREYRPEYDSLVYFKGLVLQRACRVMGTKVSRTVFVTDTRFDLEAAHMLSMPAVGVRSGYASDEMLAAFAWEVLDGFADVPARLLPSR